LKYSIKRFLCVVLISIPTGMVFADCEGVDESKLEQIVTRATKNALPAAGLYYQKKDCIIQITKGYSNLATKSDIQKNARFNSGSITKMFVAVTSVKLARAGVFSLDDTLVQWLPTKITDRIPKSDSITLRYLLSHTSGIMEILDEEFLEFSTVYPVKTWTEFDVLQFVFDKPLLFEPGTEFNYSNTNYVLMGLIINAATNKHFADNIRELIIEPLGLNDTFHLSQPSRYLDYVHGYMEINGKLQDAHEVMKYLTFADGKMISSMRDLAVFIQAIFTDKSFMDDALLETLLGLPVAGIEYKLGIAKGTKNNKIIYGHGGFGPGYASKVQYTPATKETTVYFMTGNANEHEAVKYNMETFNMAYLFELGREFIKQHLTAIFEQ